VSFGPIRVGSLVSQSPISLSVPLLRCGTRLNRTYLLASAHKNVDNAWFFLTPVFPRFLASKEQY